MQNYLKFLADKGIISEARKDSPDIIYKLDEAKGQLEAIASKSYASHITKLGRQYEVLKKSAEKIKENLDIKNTQIKEYAEGLFDAKELVNQLILKTSQTVITIAKATASKETTTVEYDKVFQKLLELFAGDEGLVQKMKEIEKECTKIGKTKEQDFTSRKLTFKNKDFQNVNPTPEELEESFSLDKFIQKIKDVYNKFKDWKKTYISKLDDVKEMFKNAKNKDKG